MGKGSDKCNKHTAKLQRQVKHVKAATTALNNISIYNKLVDKLLFENTVSARAASEFMQQSEAFKAAARVAESFSNTLNSFVNTTYPTPHLEQFATVARTASLSAIDSGMAARIATLLSQYDSYQLAEIKLPQTYLLSERVSNLARDLYLDIEAEYPCEAEEIKEAADTIELFYLEPNRQGITLQQCINVLSFLATLVAVYYAIADYYGNKKFQEQLINSQTEIIGQMYELNSHIASYLPEEAERPNGMTEYVVVRAVNLRTEHRTGKGSHVITTLMPNQKVELLKQAEHPNKKWIYVGYIDNIEGIPRTGWVYKKYLKRLEH